MDSNFHKRIKRRLYYGDMANLDSPSLPFTELSVEYFKESVTQELGQIDLDIASGLIRKNKTSPCSLVMSLLYAKRLRQKNRPYLESLSSSDIFFISMMVASKYIYDEGIDEEVFNDEWAENVGQDVEDVNEMESDFLLAMDWCLFVRPDEFESCLTEIERRLALREGIKRGWFTYSEMAVLADWSTFSQLWYNVGMECSKLSIILGASYLTSLIALLGTTAITFQLTDTLSTAVVSGLSDHFLPAVTFDLQKFATRFNPIADPSSSGTMKFGLDIPETLVNNDTKDHALNDLIDTFNYINGSSINAILIVNKTTHTSSFLSILVWDSLLSKNFSVQYNNHKQNLVEEMQTMAKGNNEDVKYHSPKNIQIAEPVNSTNKYKGSMNMNNLRQTSGKNVLQSLQDLTTTCFCVCRQVQNNKDLKSTKCRDQYSYKCVSELTKIAQSEFHFSTKIT